MVFDQGYRPLATNHISLGPSGAANSFDPVAAMTMCPRCGSSFLQPLRCEAKGSDVVLVELRCSECMTWLKAPHTRADMRELDRRQAEHRGETLAAYEKLVAESMQALADRWRQALELDLVGADDFAITPLRGGRSQGG